jgi:hypothetical protein
VAGSEGTPVQSPRRFTGPTVFGTSPSRHGTLYEWGYAIQPSSAPLTTAVASVFPSLG